MGGACSGTKKPQQKQKQQQQELKIIEQPYLHVQSMSQPQSRPSEQRGETGPCVKELLYCYKRFTDFLELLGNLDHLATHAREQLNNCIIQRSNINILIQNSIKRIMKEQKIIKRVEESDYYLIHNDKKFAVTFVQLMQKISNIILTELQSDSNFQEAFPMLIVSFVDLATQIIKEIENFQNFKTPSIQKQNITFTQKIQLIKSVYNDYYINNSNWFWRIFFASTILNLQYLKIIIRRQLINDFFLQQ